MFRATGGVNTHKGAIFTLGLLAAAAALTLGRRPAAAMGGPSPFLGDAIRSVAASMAGGLVAAELEPRGRSAGASAPESSGERLHRELGALGARGQAEAGYPVVGSLMLPVLRRVRATAAEGGVVGYEAARLLALIVAMSELEDTCVLSRGGPEGLAFVRSGARAVMASGAVDSEAGRAALERFDAELVARRLSPGGSADLLAAGIFLDAVELAHASP
jgi:triphosphoribosyl-dephospho-CoA synthetase